MHVHETNLQFRMEHNIGRSEIRCVSLTLRFILLCGAQRLRHCNALTLLCKRKLFSTLYINQCFSFIVYELENAGLRGNYKQFGKRLVKVKQFSRLKAGCIFNKFK